MTPCIDDLLGKITLAEHGVAGYQAPFQDNLSEQPKGRFVLVRLILSAVGDVCLSQR